MCIILALNASNPIKIMKPLKILLIALAVSQLYACAAITITERGDPDFLYRPHYKESKPFFFWGLVGEHRVNTQQICRGRPVVQMQTKFEPLDILYTTLTLGIYMPRTAKVWCERKVAQ